MDYKVDDIKYAKLDGRSDNGIDSLIRVDGYYTPFYDSIKNSPINILPFGLSYNNSISYPFHYTGMYCQNKLLDINGTYTIEADAEGSICITKGDTIHNVLRLHAIKTASIGMKAPEDSLGIAPGSYRQEIEDRYI